MQKLLVVVYNECIITRFLGYSAHDKNQGDSYPEDCNYIHIKRDQTC